MNAVEIEEAITALAAEPFDAAEFPYAFLEAFGSESPPAYAGGFTLVQASLGHNLPALVFLYNAV